MPREDEAEGEIAHVCACVQRIVDREQLDEPGPPIGGRRGCAVRAKAKAKSRPLEAGSSGEPDGGALITQYNQAIGASRRRSSQAQAQP